MQTTITLDPDVVLMLKRRMKEQGLTFREGVNWMLREGFRAADHERRRGRLKTKPHVSGFKVGIDPNKLNQLVDELEVEEFVRKTPWAAR